jgi:hypothetical protein
MPSQTRAFPGRLRRREAPRAELAQWCGYRTNWWRFYHVHEKEVGPICGRRSLTRLSGKLPSLPSAAARTVQDEIVIAAHLGMLGRDKIVIAGRMHRV